MKYKEEGKATYYCEKCAVTQVIPSCTRKAIQNPDYYCSSYSTNQSKTQVEREQNTSNREEHSLSREPLFFACQFHLSLVPVQTFRRLSRESV